MLFFLPDFNVPQLPEAEARHCIQVLRKSKGDVIQVCNGKGQWATAEIVSPEIKRCLLKLGTVEEKPRDWIGEIWLAVAPTKNLDRMEWMVEKLTELGCNGVIFIKTARTERGHINLERLEKMALSALKQSGQGWLPEIRWIEKWAAFPFSSFDNHWFGDLSPQSDQRFDKHLPGSHLVWIGPEGDFSPTEWDTLIKRGAKGIRLSPHILRTETAAIASLCLYHLSS